MYQLCPLRKMLRSKIHRATVTKSNIEYEGSLTLPVDLMHAANILEYEAVNVWNVTNGSRLETYAIRGAPEDSTICANGAAAHLLNVGDIIIVCTFQYCPYPENAELSHYPSIVYVDASNRRR